MDDAAYMRLALSLAEKGRGWTAPNPMVGAVLVKDGEIIGQGYHAKYGEAHAERAALAACSSSPRGATLYVTLEPGCHYGKQPPCTEAILSAGIRRVVVGSGDPNPLVAGKGIAQLRAAGIAVTEGVLKDACDALNAVFFHYIQTGRPYVVMKYAMTLDGKIAAYTGASKWITGEAARQHVQAQRHALSAIMGGGGHSAGRRPPPHLPPARGQEPGTHYLRQRPAHPPLRLRGGHGKGDAHLDCHLLQRCGKVRALQRCRLPAAPHSAKGRPGGFARPDGGPGGGGD